MKITEVKTFVVGNPWKNWVFLKVFTDEGITGLGEATGGLSTKPQVGDVEELARFVVGEDPLNPGRLWDRMLKGRFLRTSVGMTGIEIACWDILGKKLNAPLWQLLGGKQRDRLRVYANGWYQGPRDPAFFAQKAAAMVERGYTAFKFDPFGGAYLQIPRPSEKIAVSIVKAVREAVGPEVDILIEGHDRFNVPYAIRMGRLLEEFEPMLFETPVMSNDIKATLEVARAVNVPIALGERFDGVKQFGELLTSRLIGIIQPEVLKMGIGNLRTVCGMGDAYDALVACHHAQSPLCTSVNAHVHASIPNFLIHENFDDSLEPWTWDLLSGVPRVKDGYIEVPDTPGLGVELNEKEVAKHPYGEHNFLRLFEEGWETRKPKYRTRAIRKN
jgi:galactonate dehydratase